MEMITKIFPPFARPYAGRITLTVLAFIVGILFLTIGFWRTILLLVLGCIGYLIGKWGDGALDPDKLPLPARWK